jgi:hypothetical protein
MSFVIPIYLIPAYIEVAKASECAGSATCAGDTFSKCGGYNASGESSSFADAMDKGMKGMLCMMGLDSGEANAILGGVAESQAATLNKIHFHRE